MKWDEQEIQQLFHKKIGHYENDLRAIRHNRIPEDPRYKRFYDLQLGALYVYSILESCESPEATESVTRDAQ